MEWHGLLQGSWDGPDYIYTLVIMRHAGGSAVAIHPTLSPEGRPRRVSEHSGGASQAGEMQHIMHLESKWMLITQLR